MQDRRVLGTLKKTSAPVSIVKKEKQAPPPATRGIALGTGERPLFSISRCRCFSYCFL